MKNEKKANPRTKKVRHRGKMIAFVFIFFGLFAFANWFFQPVWTDWNNYNTTKGFYEEPENTIEVLFIGPSTTANGINPMVLYEQYGICAYNFGTEQQPINASYYLLEETYRLHPDSLTTVVLEVTGMEWEMEDAYVHKALDQMEFSSVKVRAILDWVDHLDEAIEWLVPLISYHDRWKELNESDFEKIEYSPNTYTRGYNLNTERYLDKDSAENLTRKDTDLDSQADAAKVSDERYIEYLERMVLFCEENDLKLVLLKMPLTTWNSAYHNKIQNLADSNGLTFLDLNFSPYYEEMDYNLATDNTTDGFHLNYYGAEKVTSFLGEWLVENADVTDVRGQDAYSFMEEELERYNQEVVYEISLQETSDPAVYIETAIENENAEIFILGKNDVQEAFTQNQKEIFREIGLKELVDLSYGSSYIGIIEEGQVICEIRDDKTDVRAEENLSEPLTYSGKIGNVSYQLISGGIYAGDMLSCRISGEEYARGSDGLNIVVYDKEKKKVIDSAVFQTGSEPARESINLEVQLEEELADGKTYEELVGNLKKLALYNHLCELDTSMSSVDTSAEGMLHYFYTCLEMENVEVVISVMGDGTAGMKDNVREALAKLGFSELAQIENEDSYLAIMRDGEVVYEKRDKGDSPIVLSEDGFIAISGGIQAGSVSAIWIDGKECSMQEKGINVVIYDTEYDLVIDSCNFHVDAQAE